VLEEKKVSLTNDASKTGYPHIEDQNQTSVSHPVQKLT
jgi:hypothetical protein